MDELIHQPRRKWFVVMLLAGLAIGLAALAIWLIIPRGLQVAHSSVRLERVKNDVFVDDVVVRATARPFSSVILDSVESGRVEEVFVKDGARVKKGDLLFRLSNPQRVLELLARQSDAAQQMSNLLNLKVELQSTEKSHRRALADLEFDHASSRKEDERNQKFAARQLVSKVALEQSSDKVLHYRRLLSDERASAELERRTLNNAITQLEIALKDIRSGLELVRAGVDALSVRAPVDGRLTDFGLQVGETVKPDQHIGRIDDPVRFKLSAEVDEYYLNRVAPGQTAFVRVASKSHRLKINRVLPQIKDGRFSVELTFVGSEALQLSPGQSLDVQISLGASTKALVLTNGAFINDSGGTWVFVVHPGNEIATRRHVQLGRRTSAQVEVLSGLSVNEVVIVSSYDVFGDAAKLQLVD